MTRAGVFLVAAMMVVCSHALAAELQLQPVSELNVTQYLGRWYQMYGDAVTQDTFELGAVCVTATYGLFPNHNGSVSVFNAERERDPVKGEARNITGYATVPDPSAPGKLQVHLAGVPVAAQYWVYLLGPVVGDAYEYAVVSDELQVSLFVLARDVARFNAQYDAYVTGYLTANGWTSWFNKPVATLQDGCVYPYPPADM